MKIENLRLEDRIKAEDSLYADMSHGDEGKALVVAGSIAIALHVLLLIPFPGAETRIDSKRENAIVIRSYVPRPPKIRTLPIPTLAPLPAGTAGVTEPERLRESYVPPDYPELARRARIEGHVVLQAIILRDGSVGEIEVLSCSRPSLGFEEAAIAAVRKWRYRPALRGERPVDVYFTVRIEFELP